MPNVILDVVPTPNTIRSGGRTNLVITYQSFIYGSLELRPSAPFTISQTFVALAPDPDGHAQLTVVIQRSTPNAGPLRCELLATFFDSSLHFFVEVT